MKRSLRAFLAEHEKGCAHALGAVTVREDEWSFRKTAGAYRAIGRCFAGMLEGQNGCAGHLREVNRRVAEHIFVAATGTSLPPQRVARYFREVVGMGFTNPEREYTLTVIHARYLIDRRQRAAAAEMLRALESRCRRRWRRARSSGWKRFHGGALKDIQRVLKECAEPGGRGPGCSRS